MGQIPFTSVATWCTVHGIVNGDDIDEIWQIVHRADGMLLKVLDKKGKEEIGRGGSKTKLRKDDRGTDHEDRVQTRRNHP
jgi:hypothetical protein